MIVRPGQLRERRRSDVRGAADPTVVFQAMTKPKHAEAYSLQESALFQPWVCFLEYHKSEVELAPDIALIYVRAPRPDLAGMMAYRVWNKFYRLDKGHEFDKYPLIGDKAPIKCLDDGDYRNAWRDAQNKALGFKFDYIGMKENPSAFVVYLPEAGPRIVVPQS